MAQTRRLSIHLTPHQLTLTLAPDLNLTLSQIHTVDLTTADDTVTFTPYGLVSTRDTLTRIPGTRTPTMQFHPYSEGASLADYAAYVMTLPDTPLPIRLVDMSNLLRLRTAAHFVKDSHLHSALTRDRRFLQVGSQWTFSGQAHAALEDHT